MSLRRTTSAHAPDAPRAPPSSKGSSRRASMPTAAAMVPTPQRYRVTYRSSHDGVHVASHLERGRDPSSASKNRWVSEANCLYPQELGFTLASRCHLASVKILMHEKLVSSQIEIFVVDHPDVATLGEAPLESHPAAFTRIG